VPRPPFRKRLVRNLRRCILLLIAPVYLWPYFSSEAGAEYGVGFFRKVRLLWLMYRNRFRIVTASGLLDQVVMVTDILRIPKDAKGVVVECGSYQGGSTTNFSLVCAMIGRELHVFDSFAGLPEPSEADKLHKVPSLLEIRTFSKGGWCGTIETVTENVRRHGNLSVCRFHQGYFDQTLPQFKEPVVFGFCDVDLRVSLETCVENLWPLLRDRGRSSLTRPITWRLQDCSLSRSGGGREACSRSRPDWSVAARGLGCTSPTRASSGARLALPSRISKWKTWQPSGACLNPVSSCLCLDGESALIRK